MNRVHETRLKRDEVLRRRQERILKLEQLRQEADGELERKVKEEDVPRLFKECLGAIDEAATKGDSQAFFIIGRFDYTYHKDEEKKILSLKTEHLKSRLEKEGYKVYTCNHESEGVPTEGYYRETVYRISVEW